MRKIWCALLAGLIFFGSAPDSVFAINTARYDGCKELPLRAYNAQSRSGAVTKTELLENHVVRWSVSGDVRRTYLSIEFDTEEKEYTADDWFYFSYYYKVNSAESDKAVTILPKYFSVSGYAEELDRYNDLSRSDREPYHKKDTWQKAEYIIPMKAAVTRKTIRTWLNAGIDSADMHVYSVDFKDPVCFYLGRLSDKKSAREITMRDVPSTGVFSEAGRYHDEYGYERWVKEGIPEVLTEGVLNGNYAFVKDCDYYWDIDKRSAERDCVRFEDDELKIKGSLANELFGTGFAEMYVSAERITEQCAEWESFYDERGFLLLSKNMGEAIDKAAVVAGDLNSREYRSYHTVSLAIGEITWNDIAPTAEDWHSTREKYLEALTYVKGTEKEYASYIEQEIKTGKTALGKLVYGDDRDLPFPQESLAVNIANTKGMAKAYALIKRAERTDTETEELKNGAIYALEMLFDNYIGKNVSLDSNWFINVITYPQMLAQTIMYLYDELTPQQIDEYLSVLYLRTGTPMVTTYYVPFKWTFNTNYTGDVYNAQCNYANLLWRSYVTYQISLLAENTSRMNHTLKYINQIFEEVSNHGEAEVGMLKNGVYEDGSFVFHGMYPYNLGYGNSFIVALADLDSLGTGTIFDVKAVYGFTNIYSWVERSYLPFMYRNTNMKIVQGRETPYGDSAYSTSVISAILLLAVNSGSDEIQAQIAELLKPMVDEFYRSYRYPTYLSAYCTMNYPVVIEKVREYLDRVKAMDAVVQEDYNYAYYNMDKFVHKRKDYTFMLSMSSERTDKFEAINNAGYTDWYIADGMTYLLMDNAQYIQRWWNNVDRYEIPGTTVDSAQRQFLSSTSGIYPDNSWAGGASDGKIASAAMILPTSAAGKSSNVLGKKSYFMLDDRIVCLGSGISGGAGAVYTTIENYISYEKNPEGTSNGYVAATVDGADIPYEFDKNFVYRAPCWAWLSNRGYVFLEDMDITVKRAKDSKRFAGVVADGNPNAGDFPFLTIRAEHGENPQEKSYGYVILPNATKAETEAYAQNKDFEVIEQSENMHALKMADGTILANIFEPCTLEKFEFQTPCSVILKPNNKGYRLSIAEPTQREAEVILRLPQASIIPAGDDPVAQTETGEYRLKVNRFYGKTCEYDIITRFAIGYEEETRKIQVVAPYAAKATILAAEFEESRMTDIATASVQLHAGVNLFDDFDISGHFKLMLWEDLNALHAISEYYER